MEEKPCELVYNCPYSRKSITYKMIKRKRGDKKRTIPTVSSISYYCVYKKERTEITSQNRHCIECYHDKFKKK